MTHVEPADAYRPASASADKLLVLVISAIFFFSGFAAIIYQIIWQRALFSIFGINVEAVTIVVVGFLLGLGFGSLLGGKLSRVRTISLLLIFGSLEIGIGLFGLVSLKFYGWVGSQTITLPSPLVAIITIAILQIPTLIMGATLPVLTNYVVNRAKNVGRSVGTLYCVNTLGSAVACFLCAVALLRLSGMQGAIIIAASINIVVGISALASMLVFDSRSKLSPPASSNIADDKSPAYVSADAHWRRNLRISLVVACVTGYVSLSYEILWFRAYSIGTNFTAAFALILGAYLAGLAGGALIAKRFCRVDVTTNSLFQTLAILVLFSGTVGYLVLRPPQNWRPHTQDFLFRRSAL